MKMTNNKKLIKRLMVTTLAATMIANTLVAPVFAAENTAKKEYVLCKSNGEVKKYIVADDATNKLNYMNDDASYPLATEIIYTLNNKTVTADEIKGTSGDVSIDINYDGSKDGYSALTLLLLDEKHFSDVKVETGKIVSDGDKSVVLGITKIPGTLHIEAKATDFEIKAMYAVATDSLMSEVDLDDFAPVLGIDISGIKNTISELKSVSSKGAGEDMSISEGITELTNGMGQLSDGLNTLDDNSEALVDGARQVFQSLIDMANEQIAAQGADIPTLTINNYSRVLSGVISQASPEGVTKTAKATVEGKVRENEATIKAAVSQAVQAEVTRQVTEKVKESVGELGVAAGMMDSPMIQTKIAAAVQEQMETKAVKKTIDEKTKEQMAALVEKNMNAPEVQSQIAMGIAKGSAGVPTLKALKNKLDSYNKFYTGLIQYTDGVSKAAEGASTINSATSEIAGSTGDLLKDDTLGLLNDADELLEKAGSKKDSVKYIIKFDSIK